MPNVWKRTKPRGDMAPEVSERSSAFQEGQEEVFVREIGGMSTEDFDRALGLEEERVEDGEEDELEEGDGDLDEVDLGDGAELSLSTDLSLQRRPYLMKRYSANDNVKLWKITVKKEEYVIELIHNVLTANRLLTINGKVIYKPKTKRNFSSPKLHSEIHFSFENLNGFVSITKSSKRKILKTSYSYNCEVNGEVLVEQAQVVNQLPKLHLSVTIPSFEVRLENGKKAVLYKIQVENLETNQRMSTVLRRYNEFYNLDKLIHRAFKGTHLYSSLPNLPGKTVASHKNVHFIEWRRFHLQSYLSVLAGNPKAIQNLHVLRFLDMDPFTGQPSIYQRRWERERKNSEEQRERESFSAYPAPEGWTEDKICIDFEDEGPLGLLVDYSKPETKEGPLVVSGIRSNGVSTNNFRKVLLEVGNGFALYEIAGQNALSFSAEEAAALLSPSSQRPLSVTFLLPERKSNREARSKSMTHSMHNLRAPPLRRTATQFSHRSLLRFNSEHLTKEAFRESAAVGLAA